MNRLPLLKTHRGTFGWMALGTSLALVTLGFGSSRAVPPTGATAPAHPAIHAETAQQQRRSGSSNIPPYEPYMTPPRVDGKIHPELIPDDAAQLAFLRAASPSVGSVGLKKSRAYLRTKLKIIDRVDTAEANSILIDRLVNLVRQCSNRLNGMKDYAERQGTPNSLELYKRDRSQLLAEFTATVIQDLGSDGGLRLQAALNDVKSKMRVW